MLWVRTINRNLANGGKLGIAQRVRAHESATMTRLYLWRNDEVASDEVERILT